MWGSRIGELLRSTVHACTKCGKWKKGFEESRWSVIGPLPAIEAAQGKMRNYWVLLLKCESTGMIVLRICDSMTPDECKGMFGEIENRGGQVRRVVISQTTVSGAQNWDLVTECLKKSGVSVCGGSSEMEMNLCKGINETLREQKFRLNEIQMIIERMSEIINGKPMCGRTGDTLAPCNFMSLR